MTLHPAPGWPHHRETTGGADGLDGRREHGDRDYYLTAEDCDLMLEQGIDPTLIDTLREALKGRDDMDLRYTQE